MGQSSEKLYCRTGNLTRMRIILKSADSLGDLTLKNNVISIDLYSSGGEVFLNDYYHCPHLCISSLCTMCVQSPLPEGLVFLAYTCMHDSPEHVQAISVSIYSHSRT